MIKNNSTIFFRKIIALLLIGFVNCISSCSKYLEEKSDKSQVVLQFTEDLQAVLDDNIVMNENTPSFGESSADDYYLPEATYHSINSGSPSQTLVYTWQPLDYNFINDWSFNYQAVFPANYCLDYIEKNERTPANAAAWDNVKGSALFFRSHRILSLLWEFAKAYDPADANTAPGVVLRVNSNFNEASKRATIQECYEQVINDTKQAINYLPLHPQQPTRPSRLAAWGLLSRIYLSMRNYDSAFYYADLALSFNNKLLDYNSSEVDPSAFNPFQRFNKEIIFYSTQSNTYFSKASIYAIVDSVIYNAYDNTDLRKTCFFMDNALSDNGLKSFKGSYAIGPSLNFTGIATDELVLTRAECFARKGEIMKALDDLNFLLSHRMETGYFIPVEATNQQECLNIILLERRKELLTRGLRWMDIKRLNKEGANIILKRIVGNKVYELSPNDNKYALPLPRDIIDRTGMQQN